MKTFFRFSIWMTILMIASAAGAYAQNTLFPTKAGTVLVYAYKNGKGQATNYSKITIKNVEGSGSNMTISYVTEMLDKNRKPLGDSPMEIPCTVTIKNGVMTLDMHEMFSNMQALGAKAEITGTPMEIPGNLQPGQSLKDADVTISVDMGIMKMKTTSSMTNGKCEAIEDVTVAAGTFKSYKITQTVSTKIMGKTSVSNSSSWYAPGVGTVKSESYNSKGKLETSMELIEMS